MAGDNSTDSQYRNLNPVTACGLYLNAVLIVDGLVGNVVQKFMGNYLIASVVGRELADMVARSLIPPQELHSSASLKFLI